jgi:hypothetical protein
MTAVVREAKRIAAAGREPPRAAAGRRAASPIPAEAEHEVSPLAVGDCEAQPMKQAAASREASPTTAARPAPSRTGQGTRQAAARRPSPLR